MRRVTFAVLGSLASAACAPTLPSVGADPAATAVTAGPRPYQSPFQDYVTFKPVDPTPWRETNDRVRDLGGPDKQMQADSEDEPQAPRR